MFGLPQSINMGILRFSVLNKRKPRKYQFQNVTVSPWPDNIQWETINLVILMILCICLCRQTVYLLGVATASYLILLVIPVGRVHW